MLAIVIPFYKIAFFQKTLASLSLQSNKNFNVYVGNDASLDDPGALIASFKKEIKITYKKFDQNLGFKSLTSQWQRCLEMVQDEEWVMILGDDDIVGKDVVQNFYSHSRDFIGKAEVVRFATTKIDEVGNPFSKTYCHPIWEMATEFLIRGTRSSLSEYIFNINKLQEVGFRNFPLAWTADKMLVFEMSIEKPIYSINESVFKIRISEQSISGNNSYGYLKNQAYYEFYKVMLWKYGKIFDKPYQDYIREKWNKTYYNNKKSISNLIQLTDYYLKKGLFIPYLQFLCGAGKSFKIKKNASRS